MKKQTRKLMMKTETVRNLTEGELHVANGGRWYVSLSLCGGDGGDSRVSGTGGCGGSARG